MTDFKTVFDEELTAIDTTATTNVNASPDREPFVKDVSRELSGIALSGGGIRSATFNLGLLQGLDQMDLLEHFDYLSTVSGGGYIGSFWSAWRARTKQATPFPRHAEGEPDSQPVRHLREFSRFLAAKWGLFEIETWQLFSALATAIVPVIGVGIAIIALIIWFVLGITATGYAAWDSHVLVRNIPDIVSAEVLVGAIALLVMFGFERVTKKNEYPGGVEYPRKTYVTAVVGALIVSVLIIAAIHYPLSPRRPVRQQAIVVAVHHPPQQQPPVKQPAIVKAKSKRVFDPGREWEYFDLFPGLHPRLVNRIRLFAPAVAWVAAMLLLILVRTHLSRWISEPRKGFYRAALDRVVARLLGMAVFWTVMLLFLFSAFLLWSRYRSLVAGWGAGVGAGSGWLYTYAQRLLSRQPTRARTGFLSTLLARYALPLLATTALISIALAVTCGLYAAIDSSSQRIAWATVAGPLVVIAFAIFFYIPNEIGMHSFYRSRLARAYLGASNAPTAAKNRQSTERVGDDLPMNKLEKSRPLHLVCCAANDLAGNHLANLSRGARSATFSPFGFTLGNRYVPWDDVQRPTPTLATAMTASAAAFNSNMGSLSMELGGAATFLMAMLNLRLGYWFHFNPKRRFFPGLDLLDEMFSQTCADEDTEAVHLSDGGHFEDLALYELLRRRCKYIIASDCGADPDVVFDDVGNALRRAREDFGVEVEIDLGVLKPNERKASRQHVAVGDIIYPDADRGVLLLFKPTLVGDEPGDVLQYRARNQSFPHESTGDQFYDEKQWESYRRLGVHAARTAFHFLTVASRKIADPTVAAIFGEARWEWLPVPSALNEQFLARSSELANIEKQLTTVSPALMRDLYPELGWKKGAPGSTSLTTEELAKIIPLFTQVIQLMEDVYVSCIMERYWSHPLNVGWVNLFGRWATTPLFRDWWPVLSPMYSPRVARFIEEQFNLPSTRTTRALNGRVDKRNIRQGVAWEIWQSMHRLDSPPTRTLWRYEMELESGHPVNAALVFVDDTIPGQAFWKHEDFFVPPSFWGARIGQLFLRAIPPGTKLTVTIKHDPAHKKEFSDAIQLYRESGFRS
ncbi:MAG: hypothetical protein QOE82_458, partial [Thermoanaerobaculia bacterium]|nr:hypothetical protein [Thermoanaerobaculia bacterium]